MVNYSTNGRNLVEVWGRNPWLSPIGHSHLVLATVEEMINHKYIYTRVRNLLFVFSFVLFAFSNKDNVPLRMIY